LKWGSLRGSEWRFSEGAGRDALDSSLESSVTGGGLQRSYIGSPDPLNSNRVAVGAITAVVTISEWASKNSNGRLSLLSMSAEPVVPMSY